MPNLILIQNNPEIHAPEAESVRKLAESLRFALRIQSGCQLIYCLGNGGEQSNHEALQTWVRTQLLKHGLRPTRQALAFLIVELEKSLNRWETDQ